MGKGFHFLWFPLWSLMMKYSCHICTQIQRLSRLWNNANMIKVMFYNISIGINNISRRPIGRACYYFPHFCCEIKIKIPIGLDFTIFIKEIPTYYIGIRYVFTPTYESSRNRVRILLIDISASISTLPIEMSHINFSVCKSAQFDLFGFNPALKFH